MLKVVCSTSNDPYYNVAYEKYLLEVAKEDILYLWINKPVVVIGRNQNIYNEVNLAYLEEEKIDVVRRFSGGGAVFQDLGNVNYSFITNHEDDSKLKEILTESFRSLGLTIEFSGRNDILLDGKKISGYAYLVEDEKYLFHGTMLIDVDFNKLKNVLTPSKLKLEGHHIKSVSSRVINIKEVKKDFTNDLFIKTLIDTASQYYDEVKREKEISTPRLSKLITKLRSKEWIYNDSPDFDLSFDAKGKDGIYKISLKISKGIIEKVSVSSDTLDLNKVEELKEALKFQKFNRKTLEKTIQDMIGYSVDW